ncbi:MAG: TrpB-like pyridoxal phosphate-dependent enzyme [Candidatus Glassbacteria bacterium]
MNLSAKDMVQSWYNVVADLPEPMAPPLNPGTGKPLGPEALTPIFPMALILQEVSTERWIEIPDPVNEVLKLWRPTPLHRAVNLEKALGTPARIYYKNESQSPPGSHKPNTAVAQAYYNKEAGVRRISTETGAGQWGSALAFACNLFGLDCTVYMVKVSYEQKPMRKSLMHIWNAEVYPSPSDRTNSGRMFRERFPGTTGSLGMAISEAVEDAATHEDTNYSLGSVLNHVMLHQTVIGLEARKQFEAAGDWPDVLIGCAGGGSNFAGFTLPFVPDKLAGKDIRIIATEPAACPSLTKGPFRYDFGDTGRMTPLLKMYTLGHVFVPPGIHAGGLRYHGMAPIVSHLKNLGIIEAVALHQVECFEAGTLFAQTEGIIPAPETNHAIRAVILEALKCKETRQEKCIAFNFSGHGHLDLSAYDKFHEKSLEDYEYPKELIEEALKQVPVIE